MEGHTRWSSRISFIFAASAAAIGLGNIWRFPYMTGQNGGSAFVLIYLICVLALGLPLLVAEIVIGKTGRANPVRAMANMAKDSGSSRRWGWVGGMTIAAAFFILTYYVVIVGWVLDYSGRAVIGQFHSISESASVSLFTHLKNSRWEMLLTDTLVVFGTLSINILGIKRGLERAVLIMFPALLVLMLILLGYAMTTGKFEYSLHFLFAPDFSKITAKTMLEALGQAFFSLNIAMGVTMMFSAYLPERVPVTSSAVAIAIADTGVALLAGLIIFPIVFAYGLTPSAGPSLIFETLPIAFGQMPYGSFIAALFFIMLFFAAFTSVIALIEPVISWMIETFNIKRPRAVNIACIALWLFSLLAITSFSDPKTFSIDGITYFKGIDFVTASIMLPLGGLFIAVFTGWYLSKELLKKHIDWNVEHPRFKVWRFLLRYFAPVAILLILLATFGII